MVKGKICHLCKNKILLQEKYVLLGTYEDNEKNTHTFEEQWFHIQCWKNYMKQMIDVKIEKVRQDLMKSAGTFAGKMMQGVRAVQ